MDPYIHHPTEWVTVFSQVLCKTGLAHAHQQLIHIKVIKPWYNPHCTSGWCMYRDHRITQVLHLYYCMCLIHWSIVCWNWRQRLVSEAANQRSSHLKCVPVMFISVCWEWINYLFLQLEHLFILGSPLGMFLALRDVEQHIYRNHKSAQSLLPASICKRIHNIHHPSDPIVRMNTYVTGLVETFLIGTFYTVLLMSITTYWTEQSFCKRSVLL